MCAGLALLLCLGHAPEAVSAPRPEMRLKQAAWEALEEMRFPPFEMFARPPERGTLKTERWMAKDKARHFGLSLVGSLGLAAGLRSEGMADSDCPGWAGASMFSLGVFKEVALDRHHPGSAASWRDAAADLAGVLAGGLIWTLADD